MGATFKFRETQGKKKLNFQTNTVLRVTQFQPAHAALTTELFGESFRMFLDCVLSLFHVSINVSFFLCFLCRIFQIATHPFLFDMHS